MLALAMPVGAQQTGAVDLLSRALYEENVNADFNKASQIYQQLLKEFPQDKKSCAQANYRLGLCSERLGLNNSQEYFITVIEKYSDETDIVEKARAKISNTEGIQYFTDPRDGHRFKAVTIGRQVWMAENLAYMPYVSPGKDQGGIWVLDYNGNNTQEASQLENYKKYGCLYDYKTALVACPPDWHLSTENDWMQLERYLGYHDSENNLDQRELKKANPIAHYIVNTQGKIKNYWENFTGLNLLPGGWRSSFPMGDDWFLNTPRVMGYYQVGSNSETYGGDIYFTINNDSYYRLKNSRNIHAGFSVRCVKNNPGIEPRPVHPLVLEIPRNGDKVIGLVGITAIANKSDLIDSACLYIEENEQLKVISTDYSNVISRNPRWGSKQNFNEFAWDTRLYKDGIYNLALIAYHYGYQRDTLKFKLEVANNFPSPNNGTLTDPRDGQAYPIVKIGEQVWMAKNLNYLIDEGTGSFCYNDLYTNCLTYGRLYTFETARKVCPPGWHLPNNKDWIELELFLGLDTALISSGEYFTKDSSGIKLKSQVGWRTYDPIKRSIVTSEGTNEVGFNALPGGFLEKSKKYTDLGEYTSFWTSTLNDYGIPTYRGLGFSLYCIDRDEDYRIDRANYVRCIKD
jgi:uncharacterized protein (TIGR02145 family)